MNHLVVAGYNMKAKDVRWLGDFDPKRVTVYEKPHDLPNVGREAHTYFHHIYTHYDDLAPVTVFTQDDITKHVTWDKPATHKLYATYDDILEIVNEDRREEYLALGYVHGLADVRPYEELFKSVFFSTRWELLKDSPRTVRCASEFGTTIEAVECGVVNDKWLKGKHLYPTAYYCFFGSIFAVSRERIHRRPREWYGEMLKLLDWDVNPLSGHFCERAWPYFFGEPLPIYLVKLSGCLL